MSSREETGRYRGRRRAPTPPRARYAAVVTTAFVGAGLVALGAAHAMPDLKTDPATLTATNAALGDSVADAGRQSAADRANRSDRELTTLAAPDLSIPDLWLLPLKQYQISAPFGQQQGSVHPGLDLAAPGGTPYYAAHAGKVTLARFYGGYGYTVMLDLGNGVSLVYGHSAKLLVHEGQMVQAGDVIGLVGDTGYTYGDQLHFEVRVGDKAVDPVAYLAQNGLDIANSGQPEG